MKILFIACYSPFINNSASIETLQYLNKLSNTKEYEVHLLSVNFHENSAYYDKQLASMIDEKIKIHLIDGGKIFNKFMPKKSVDDQNVDVRQSKKFKFLRKIKNYITIPDMYYAWAKKAYKYGIELMKKEKFDVIFSMHEPPSSHLCAYKIKKNFKGTKWITYWSDPWLKDSTRQNSPYIKQKIEEGMERKVVNLSDRFLFVTEPTREDYIKTYNIPKEKTDIVSRGFNLDFYLDLEKQKKPKLINDEKINILYAGEIFTKLRNVQPFIEALNKIKENNIDLYKKMNILFFGNIDNNEIKNKLQEVDIVSVNGRISFDEASRYMVNADILLLFGNKNSTQIPAKIYDYFGAKGKIFVIYGDDNDPLKKIVENNEKCICTENSSEKIASKLTDLIKLPKEQLFSERYMKYEWGNVVEELIRIINKN